MGTVAAHVPAAARIKAAPLKAAFTPAMRARREGDQGLVGLRKYNWLAAVFGILLTARPMLWFTSWLEKQGDAEAMVAADRTVNLAEFRILQAVTVLHTMAARGIDSCKPAHVEALRQAVFASGAVKELAILGSNGETLCTDAGVPTSVHGVSP